MAKLARPIDRSGWWKLRKILLKADAAQTPAGQLKEKEGSDAADSIGRPWILSMTLLILGVSGSHNRPASVYRGFCYDASLAA